MRKRQIWIFDAEELSFYVFVYFVAATMWSVVEWTIIRRNCVAIQQLLDTVPAPDCDNTGIPAIAHQSIAGWLWLLGLMLLFKFGRLFWQAWGPRSS